MLAGVAQAALSQQLGILENEFRCTLLVRSRSGVQLTPSGTVLYREAQGLLRRTAELKDLVRRNATEVSGVVSIGLSTTNVNLFAAQLVQSVREQHPNIQLRITEGMSWDLAQGIVQGRLDFATLPHDETRGDVSSREIWSEPLYVVASSTLALGAEIFLADLARLPLILASRGHTLRARYDALFTQAGVQPLHVAETDSVNAMKTVVLAGAGVAILPRSTWLDEVDDGRVTLTRIADQPLRHHVWLASRRPQSDAVAAVEVLLTDAMARSAALRHDP